MKLEAAFTAASKFKGVDSARALQREPRRAHQKAVPIEVFTRLSPVLALGL